MARNKDFFVNSTPKRDKSFFVKEDTAKKTNDLWVESTAPNVLQKQNINATVKPVNISDFVNQVKNSEAGQRATLTMESDKLTKQIQQKEKEYNQANNISDWNKKNQSKAEIGQELNNLKEKLDATKTSLAELNRPNEKLLTAEQVAENNKNAPLSQKIDKAIKYDIPKTAEKVGRTALDLGANVAVGATNAFEGMADAAVGNLGALASGVTSGFGLAPNSVSEKIKERAERFVNFNFSGEDILEEKKNEGTGIYEPKILGVKVRDALNTISNMVTSAAFGGTAGFVSSAAGQNIEEALNDNQSLNRAVVYGDIAGAVEGLTEKMFDAVKLLGGGKFDKFLPKGAIGKLIGGSAGEAIEEVIADGINPFLKAMTYEKGTYDMPTLVEYLNTLKESAWNGFVIGLIMKGGQDISTPQIREQYKEEIYIAVDKSNLPENVKQTVKEVMITPAQAQINQDLQNLRNQNPQSVNSTIQRENVTGLPKLEAQNQAQTQNINQPNITLPNQAEMAQNANMRQITQTPNLPTQKAQKTLQSAKIAGMTDMDMQKAIDLNNMLRSGASLEFYDAKNIPENVQADKAKVANGFYKDGTLWINKNSKNKVEQILGHELTHHLETTNSYNDLSNTILDSEIFYDFVAEKGYTNVAEYKTKLKEMGYTDAQMNNEMVARFVEEKMFTDQASIDRLARQNTKLVEKIKNWISDLVVSFKGTSQEKELRRIENMYRKALEQARNTTASAETQYSIGGTKGWNNLAKTGKYAEDSAGWFRDKNGDLKFEFSDKLLKLKDGIKLYSNKSYKLGDILEHEVLFDAYPQLRKYNVEFEKLKNTNGKNINLTKTILLNPETLNTNEAIEKTLLHEIQHAIQKIEGFEGGRNSRRSKLAYYESLGEIEAADTVERFEREKVDRNYREKVMPRSAEANPQHPKLQSYLQNRKEADIIKDEKYLQDKERKQKIKDAIDEFFGWEEVNEGDNGTDLQLLAQKDKQNSRLLDRGGLNNEESDNSNIYKTTSEDDKLSSRTDGRGRLAGKEPAFSMPETDNQGRKLSKEQQEFFKDSKVRDKDGKLIEVYHRTNQDFTEFDRRKIGSATDDGIWGSGFYFSNRDHDFYGKNVIKGYLNITNPLVMRDFKTIQEIADYLDIVERNFNYEPDGLIRPSYNQIAQFTSHVIDKGHDGVVADHGNGVYEYVIFEPNQIKNVDNTNPTENPDIRYSMNPVNIAKTPPNIETGLDQLKRTSRVKEGDTQSSFTKNIYNQSIFDEKFKDLALDDKNIQSYERISNKETLQQANDAINEQGQKWVDRFLDKPNGELKATDIAGGFILMNRYQQVGDYESMIRVAEKLRKAGTQQGQTIQMFSVLGRMTPEGMTYYAQKELNKAYDEILKNKTQKWADEHADEFKLNEKDIEYIQRRVNQAARMPEGRDKYVLLGEIASRIQNKIPPQAGQGLKALARNSMLLNPKTMVRNILGNVVIVPNHIISDFVGSGIDKAISKKTGVRTTGGFDVKALQGAKKGVYESFDDFRRQISTREMGGDRFEIGQGKNFYENHTGRFAETRNKINKALNGLDRVTGFLLETGDRPFYETWFMNSLNNQMKLNNVTEPTAEMIEIATDEALQRTWQDNNTYTKFVNSIRKGMNNLNVKGYGLGDIVMPFVKTPANLTKAVVDFSPLGAINAAIKTSQFNKDIEKGTATTKQQREVVKAWSQVITGTLGMAIMAGLANAGILGGGSEEDKDVRAFEQNVLGIKPYSIKIGDKTYTYDWAQPLGTSAAMVADTVKSLKNAKDTEGKVAAILEGAQSGASVLLEQSFVSGIRNLFEEDNLINALIETGLNEPSKFTPQFLSQLAQIQDDTARTSYVYNNPLQTAENKIKAKIPGLRETLEPSVDVLGREVKTDNSIGNVMFNPANTAMARTTEGAEEMYRVYKATGEKSAIAQVAPYYFNVGSEKIVLTPKQRTQYQKTTGKIASDGVENLIDNKAYKNLTDAEKAEILSELYSYGNAVAKEEATTKYLLPKDMQKIKDSGMKPEEYILAKHIANNGGTKKEELYDALTKAGYSKKQTESFLSYYKGYKFESKTTNTLPTISQQRAKLPTLKK